jgi:hypothetical protein
MGLSEWWAARRKKKDDEEIQRRQHQNVETADERQYQGDFQDMVADHRAAGRIGEADIKGVNRMGDF